MKVQNLHQYNNKLDCVSTKLLMIYLAVIFLACYIAYLCVRSINTIATVYPDSLRSINLTKLITITI